MVQHMLIAKIRTKKNKVDHFKVKLRLPLVYHVGFSIKVEVDGDVDGEVDVEVTLPLTNPYQPSPTHSNPKLTSIKQLEF